jgi:hypothetical protein
MVLFLALRVSVAFMGTLMREYGWVYAAWIALLIWVNGLKLIVHVGWMLT